MLSRSCRHLSSHAIYAACVSLGVLAALHAQQTGEKLVDAHNDIEQITDAVLISNIVVASKTVECGLFIKPPVVIQPVTPFQAGPDWLSQMTISVVNRTNKVIVFGDMHVHFLDTGDCRSAPCVGAELTVGQMPGIDAYDGRTADPSGPSIPRDRPSIGSPKQPSWFM